MEDDNLLDDDFLDDPFYHPDNWEKSYVYQQWKEEQEINRQRVAEYSLYGFFPDNDDEWFEFLDKLNNI